MENKKPMNRAQRREQEKINKRARRKRKLFIDSMKDTATKMAYIEAIQALRRINAKLEEEKENEVDVTDSN